MYSIEKQFKNHHYLIQQLVILLFVFQTFTTEVQHNPLKIKFIKFKHHFPRNENDESRKKSATHRHFMTSDRSPTLEIQAVNIILHSQEHFNTGKHDLSTNSIKEREKET